MGRSFRRMSQTLNLPPGTLVHIGEKKTGKPRITVFDYDGTGCREKEIRDIEECYDFRDRPTVTWINIDGLSDLGLIRKINAHFGVHDLVLEDIVNTEQRAKFEDYGGYLFVVVKMLAPAQGTGGILSEQVSLLVGPNYVISFQEREGDVFDEIRTRIRDDKGRIRKTGADYLAYCLIDAIVDHYFRVLEGLGEKVETLEERTAEDPSPAISHDIHRLKREVILFRKQVWPLREVIAGLQRSESKIVKRATDAYLRDLYDHTIQIIDTIELMRDILSGMHDLYLSTISNRMNAVMKVLTIFASIFIPLTFVTGLYGMNFEYMPGLKWPYGFLFICVFMGGLAAGMLFYFKKKKWF